jgi:ATP-dependent exoDNAse (exonuclease V) alpha subunit
MTHIYHINIDQVETSDSSFDISSCTVDGSTGLKTLLWNLDKGRHVTISGGAGSGKSFLLKEFIKYVREQTDNTIRVTAPTGVSAFNVEGETIYRALGLGLACEPMHVLWAKIKNATERYTKGGPQKRKRNNQDEGPPYEQTMKFLRETDYFIIDEAYMMNPNFFVTFDYLARKANGSDLVPFGGKQLVLVGDAMQLGPILPPANIPFIFNTESFKNLNMARIHLCHNYRQRDNADFIDLLNAVRFGNVHSHHLAMIQSRLVPVPEDAHCVRMFCHRKSVDEENDRRLQQLLDKGAQLYQFDANYSISIKQYASTTVKPPAELKIAQERLKNQKFLEDNFVIGDIKFCMAAQMMLRTNDYFNLGLYNGSLVEVIGFSATDGIRVRVISGQELNIGIKQFRVPVTKSLEITLHQYPLCLAWAITIHKSQSLTLPCIQIDLSSCFSPGQAYVALSRATDLSGIYLTGFQPKSILTCQTAAAFENLPNPFHK